MSLAAEIKQALDIDAVVTPGNRGQFDVTVDGELLASRQQRLLLGERERGFPAPADVIEALRARQQGG